MVTAERAAEIMGQNIFLPQDWEDAYKLILSGQQTEAAKLFPWKEVTLISSCPLCGEIIKNCHFAYFGVDSFSGAPLNIQMLQKLHPVAAKPGEPRFERYSSDQWFSKEKFTNSVLVPGWRLLHINIVPSSRGKPWEKQRKTLAPGYAIPTLLEELLKNLLFFKKTGGYANPKEYGRCAEVDSFGLRVDTGGCNDFGRNITINHWDGNTPYPAIGIAASRKPEA